MKLIVIMMTAIAVAVAMVIGFRRQTVVLAKNGVLHYGAPTVTLWTHRSWSKQIISQKAEAAAKRLGLLKWAAPQDTFQYFVLG